MSRELSPALLGFLTDAIQSVEQVEVLLLLRASRESGPLSPDEISQRLRSNPESVRSRLAILVANGLVRGEGDSPARYRYSPSNDALASQVDELAEAYASRRSTLIGAIHGKKRDPLRDFADAFQLTRKDPKSDA